jgi:hypothetical protein
LRGVVINSNIYRLALADAIFYTGRYGDDGIDFTAAEFVKLAFQIAGGYYKDGYLL